MPYSDDILCMVGTRLNDSLKVRDCLSYRYSVSHFLFYYRKLKSIPIMRDIHIIDWHS